MPKNTTTKSVKAEKATPKSTATCVIAVGGKQYVVSDGQKIVIEKVGEAGKTIECKDILSDKKVTLSLEKEVRGPKILNIKFKNKTRYMRRLGHRQTYMAAVVTSIA